jgi:hypothetical protein
VQYKIILKTTKKTSTHMKKTWILGLALIAIAIASCTGNGTAETAATADSTATDSVVVDSTVVSADTLAADTAN